MGTDLNGRKPKTSVEKNSNKQGKMDEQNQWIKTTASSPLEYSLVIVRTRMAT